MAYPPTIEQLPYNWWTDRAGQPIVAIIAHGTVGTDSRAYLSRGGDAPDGSDRKVSIHVLIQKPGSPIYRYVPDERGANHAGYGTMPAPWAHINPNKCTLGFELENLQDGKDPYTYDQLMAMGWQINQWRAKHGPLPIYRHADIDPTRRSDTVGLTVAQIEEWCKKAAASNGAGIYRVRHTQAVFEAPTPDAKVALNDGALVYAGATVDIDEIAHGGWAHLRNGVGFVPSGILTRV
jgi:N-acetyl-anhydromuramyl-L-alanine amidase AmpD